MIYILSYDVESDKRRNKIFQLLKSSGYHSQKSVFLLDCANREVAEGIFRKVEELIDKDKDRLFMSPLCRQCFSNKMTSGQKMEIEDKLVVC